MVWSPNCGDFLGIFSRKCFIWAKSRGHNERCAAARKPLCVTCTLQIIPGKMDLRLCASLFPATPITGGPSISFGVGGSRKICSLNYTTSSSLFILESCRRTNSRAELSLKVIASIMTLQLRAWRVI